MRDSIPRRIKKAERRVWGRFFHAFLLPSFVTSFSLGLVWAWLCLSPASVAHGQAPSAPALPAALERPEATRPEQRAELQRQLDRQAGVLEAQSAVVKTVATRHRGIGRLLRALRRAARCTARVDYGQIDSADLQGIAELGQVVEVASGGDGDGNGEPSGSSNWDELIWSEDNWG